MLGPADLTTAEFAPGSVPDGSTTDPVGRTLAAPLRRGEPVTDVRLVGAALTSPDDDAVAVPVRLPDAAMVDLLTVGDRIDLIATDPEGSGASVVAADVPVLALPQGRRRAGRADRCAGRRRRPVLGGDAAGRLRRTPLPHVRVRPLA